VRQPSTASATELFGTPPVVQSPITSIPYLENLHLLNIMIGNEKEANVILESAPFYSREVACSNEEEALISKLLGDMYSRLGSIGKKVECFS